MAPLAVPTETAGVLIQTAGFRRDKPRPNGSNQRDKRVGSADAAGCWESQGTGSERTLSEEERPRYRTHGQGLISRPHH